ncbi:MAG: DUF1573 domain-containing protein [Bacteroidales bacterium]|nr:DUF1573 domain-containing protein [Bacteroidales bacterium]
MRLFIIYIFLSLGLFSCVNNKPDDDSAGDETGGTALIEFNKLSHDFGKISEGELVACVFKFENKGDADLLISSATTSCGCTVPEFDDSPVPPGGSGHVEVVFDSAFRHGIQNKTITIRSNAKRPVVILKIKAEVITKN